MAALTVTIAATKAHVLGTATDLIDSGATVAGATGNFQSGDTLTISGLTIYDTLSLKTSGAAAGDIKLVGNEIQFHNGTSFVKIASFGGGDGQTATIAFDIAAGVTIDDALATKILQNLTISASTTGTTVEARSLVFTFAGTNSGTDTVAYTITGSANADTVIYSADAIAFDPLGGDDILKVDAGAGVLSLDMKTASQLEKFEVLDATNANSAITLTMGSGVKTVTLGSAADIINIAAATDIGATATINGGQGDDKLVVTADAQTIAAADLAKLTSVEILQTKDGANSITLGATNSIKEIIGGAGVDTIDASARTVASAGTDQYDLKITTGAGNDVVTLSQGKDNIDLGADDNELIITQASDLTADDVIKATGSGTADKITLDNAITSISDAQFTQVTGFEELVVGTGATTLTLGDEVRGAGIKTITGDAASGALTVDMTAMTADITGVTVTGSDNGLTVKVRAEDIEATDLFTGGAGADVLEVATSGTITAAELAGVTAIETLNITATSGNVSVTINDNDFTAIDSSSSTGNNTIITTAETSAIAITTGDGNDTITAGDGDTTIITGNGTNTVTLGTGTNSVTGGTGNDTVNLVAGTDTLHLGAGDNIVKVTTYADFDSSDSISEDGTNTTSAGTNTLQFDVAVVDGIATVESKLGGTNKIDIIKLGDDSTQIVTLGANALASKVIEVDGSAITTDTNVLTVDLTAMHPTSGTFTVKGGAGNDIVKINSADLTSTTSLQMGGQVATTGFDTLEMLDVSTIIDDDFSLSTGLEKITFNVDGAHNITLGDKAIAAGVRTIDTSILAETPATKQIVASTINLSSATTNVDMNIKMGSGNDSLTMKAGHLVYTDATHRDVIDMGLGSDTLTLTDGTNVTIVDAAFTDVLGVEKLVLGTGNNQKLIYGAEAKEAGITVIDGSGVGAGNKVTVDLTDATNMPLKVTLSSGDDTVIMSDSGSTDGDYDITLGDGTNLVQTASAFLTSGDKITGGSGIDTLQITDAATVIDGDFDKITNFEKLVLADGVNSVELGAKAKAAGVVTIDGSASASALTATVTDIGFNITGGSGADTIKIGDAQISSLTLDAGTGIDIVELTDTASLTDSDFTNLRKIETLKLNDFNGQTITLGSSSVSATNAINSGLTTIDASGLLGVNNISVDISGMTTAMSVTTAGGADTVTLGRGVDTVSTGAGDDIIKVSSENFTSADTINGGGQTGAGGILGDILEITSTTNAIIDTHFDNISGIETIKLSSTSGTYNITLGETHAYTNGIKEIAIADGVSANIDLSSITSGAIKITKVGTTGNVTVTTSTTNQTDDFIFGSGADTVKIISANLTSADSYEFGAGADTLQITDAATVVDADFTNITGLETIKVANTANSITLSDIAKTAGVTTVDLSSVITSTNAQSVDTSSMLNDLGLTVTGGAGIDTIKMKAEHFTTTDNLTGGNNTDILEFTTLAVGITDTDFTNTTGIETLKLVAGASGDIQSLILGTQAFDSGNGLNKVDGSAVTGKVTVDLTAASDVTILAGSTGDGTAEITMDSSYLTSADTLTAGTNTLDKIIFDTAATSVAATAFTGVSGFEILELQATTGAQSVTLGGSGITTVDAHTTDTAITVDGATTTGINLAKVLTGSGADTLKIEAVDLDANDSFVLGGGTDTLEITTDAASTITDSDFTNKTGVETLKLANVNGQVVTLANTAITAGINKVDLTSLTAGSSATVDLSTMTTENVNFTVLGGAGADTIKMVAAQLTSTDVLTGNGGSDILQFTTVSDGIIDTQFTGVTGIETLEFANASGQSITLGDKALEVGAIRTIDADALTGSNSIAITIADTTTNHALTIKTGAGADTVTMKAEDLTSADSIVGGGGTDTLSLSANGANTTIGVSAFTNVSGVEVLKLNETGSYTQNITLASGFTTVDASVATDDVIIDGATTTGVILASVTTGSGDDTLKIEAGDLDAADSFNLGTGADILEITTDAGSTITDSDFTNILRIETLKLSKDITGQLVTLGDTALNAGIRTVDLTSVATGTTTVDLSSMNQYQDITVSGGSANETIKMKAEHLSSGDTISGNSGTADTLEFTTQAIGVAGAAMADTVFTNVTGVEVLKLGNFANQSILLGDEALGGGIRTVDATALATTNSVSVDMSGATTNYGVTINSSVAGTGDDSVKMKAADLTSADTIALGAGTGDKLILSTAATSMDTSSFQNISGVEILELQATAGTQNITLAGGITTVDASVATAAVTIDGATTTSLDLSKVTTGTGDDTLKLQNADFTSADSLAFGTGTDTLQVSDAATITNAQFTNVTGLENITMLANVSGQSIILGDLAVSAGVQKVDFSAITNTQNSVSVSLQTISSDSTTKIIAGAGADTITMKAAHLTSADTLTGGDSTDKLVFTDAATLVDSAFTNVSGIETLQLADFNNSLTLGDNGLRITKIDGTALTVANALTIDMSSATSNTNITILASSDGGSTGADSITMKSEYLDIADTITGGTGTDTLVFSDAATLTTSDFTNVSGIENITLQATAGAQNIEFVTGLKKLDASVATAAVTVDALTNGTTDLDITTGSGADVVKVIASTLNGSDVINGGAGTTDTLEIVGAGVSGDSEDITDAKIVGVTNVEILKLLKLNNSLDNDTVEITLGTNGSNNGIKKVDASATGSNNTINLSDMTTDVEIAGGSGSDIITGSGGDNVIDAGAGNDTVTISATTLTADDTIVGGAGDDTLILTGLTTDTTSLANVSGFESIKLADGNGQEIILGAAGDTNNILKIDASSVTNGNTVTVDITDYEIVTDIDDFVYVGGAGDDTFKMQSTHLTQNDTLNGGAGTDDVLELTDVAINSTTTTIFNNVSNFETLKLADIASDQLVTLKDGVFTTVDSSANTSTNALNINAGNVTGNITIKTAGGADTITAAKGVNTIQSGAGNDTIKFNITTYADSDVINGGDGTDTLEFVDATTVITDAMFTSKTNLEKIKLSFEQAGQTVTIGTNASAAGINEVDTLSVAQAVTIDAGSLTNNLTVKTGAGGDTITLGNQTNTVLAGAGNDTIKIDATTLNASDNINGEGDADTLELTGVATLVDSAFTEISNIETLKLADETGQTLVLGAEAKLAGFTTIDSSALSTGKTASINLDGFTQDTKIIGGAGEETVTVKASTLDANDDINLGAGTDKIIFTDVLSSTPNLSKLKGVETIQLADGNNQLLTLVDTINTSLTITASTLVDTNKSTIDASALGTATTTFSVTTSTGADTIILGSSTNNANAGGGDDTIKISMANLIDGNADTINGGTGTNILDITTGGTVADARFTDITNISKVVLSKADGTYNLTLATKASANDIISVDGTALTTGTVTIDASTLGNETITFKGGDVNDTFAIAGVQLTSADTIDGKSTTDTDTLLIKDGSSTAVTLVDSAFTNISNMEKITFGESAGHSVTAGEEFRTAGFKTIDASVLETTFTFNASSMTTDADLEIIGGTGIDTITMNATHLTTSDAIKLGNGANILELSGQDTITDADFNASSTGVKTIKFTDNLTQDITVGTNAITGGLTTIDATGLSSANATINASTVTSNLTISSGGGTDDITLGGGNSTVATGAGNDTIKITKANLTSDDSINGVSGDDILNITDSADGLTDSVFTKISNMEELKLSLTTAQSITLGNSFKAAGFDTITASTITAGVTVDISSMAADGNFTITSGSGDDLVKMVGTHITNSDVIDLAGGSDTIEFTSSAATVTTISDDDFSNLSGVETIKFANYSNSVEFGDEMKEAGVTTIDGSTNSGTGYGLSVDMTNMSTANTTAISGYTLLGGGGNDTFKLRADQLSASDTIDGNGNGTSRGDTLEFTTSVIFNDAAKFFKVYDIETIKLSNTSGQKIVLRDGLTKVLDASSLTSYGITVDSSALGNNITINTGTGDDIITLGAGNDILSLLAGDDTVTVASANFTSNDTINFGLGNDELTLYTAATLIDDAFTKITSLETITLADGVNSLTLGEFAKAAGLSKIDNSASASTGTFNMSSMSSNIPLTFLGGSDVDTIQMQGNHLNSDDTISGGNGTDVLYITSSPTTTYITDDAFTNVTSIETLKLGDGTHNITLGTLAEAAGITTIDTSLVTNPLVIDISGTSGAITITGRDGADTITIGSGVATVAAGAEDDIIKTSSANLTTDTIDGEGGTDSLVLTTAINETTATKFTNVSNVENLVLGDFDAQEVTLGATPFSKVDGSGLTGTNGVKINATAVETDLTITTKGGNDTIIAGDVVGSKYTISSGNGDDLIQFTDSAVITLANDKIDGELGNDTLEFTSTLVASVIVNDTFGTHIKSIETIKFGDVTGNSITSGQKILDSGVRIIDSTNVSTGSTTTITLTSANQNMTVNGGDGIDLVTAGDRNDTINLGAGDDKVTFTSGNLNLSDTVNGGDGTDIVSVLSSGTINDDVFTNFSNIETLELLGTTSDKNITLGTKALNSGLNTIDADAIGTRRAVINGKDFSGNIAITTATGNDEITIGSGDVTIDSGLGNDLIKVEGRTFDISDSIDGGDATDKDIVQFTDAVTLTNAMLGRISDVETIKFSDGSNQSVEIGDNAVTKIIKIFDASSISTGNKIAMDLSSMTSDLDMTLTGGNGDDSFTFKENYFTATDTIIGGSGTDKIIFSDVVDSGAGFDALFDKKSQVETIVLNDVGDHVFTIGTKARDAGIKTIDAQAMSDSYSITVDASAFTSNLSIISNAGDDVIIAGSGNDSYILGNGDDKITFKSGNLSNSDIVQGGVGSDTMYISNLANINDNSMQYVTGFEKMVLSNTAGNTTITLSTNGEKSGLVELDGSAMVGTSTIDISAMSIDFTLKTGSGIDTIKAGGGILDIEAGDEADKISMSASNLTSDDAINGGNGSDQLIITTASTDVIGVGIVDADFTNITSVESLLLSNFDNQKVVLGSLAKAAGLTFIDAGAVNGSNSVEIDERTLNIATFTTKTGGGADTIYLGTSSDSIISGGGDDTIIFRNADFTSADYVDGGDGNTDMARLLGDKIQISDAATIIDEDFTNVKNVEILKVGNFTNQSIKLGANASRVSLDAIDATASYNSVLIDIASITTQFNLYGSQVGDTIKISSENLARLSGNLKIDGGGVLKTTNTNAVEGVISAIATGEIIYNNDGNSANGADKTYYMALNNFTNVDLDAEDFSDTNDWKAVTFEDNVIVIDKATITDGQIVGFKNLETLTLSDANAQSLTLGTNATNAGLTKIDASATTSNNGVTINIADLKTDVTVLGGAGSDTVTIKMANTTNGDSINLGTGTNDTLIIGDAVTATTTDDNLLDNGGIADGTFDGWLGANGSGLAGIESLKLSNFGGQTLVLGANANTLGLNNIDLSTVGNAVTVDATSLATGLTLTATSGNHIITTATGNYNDNINAGNGVNTIYLDGGNDVVNLADGDDIIQISSANLSSSDTIVGGNGKDTLLITDATTAMSDAQFTNISYTEVLKLTSAATGQKVVLGNAARVAGINTVDASVIATTNNFELDISTFSGNLNFIAGASNDTFTGGQGNDTVTAGAGDDVFNYSSNYFNSYDRLAGGDGTDTLIITDKANLTDGMFDGKTSIETLKLGTNVSGQTIELGSRASNSGLTTLDLRGIDGANYTVNTANFNGALNILVDRAGGSFTTSSRDDTITIQSNMLNEYFVYNGGNGTDTIKLSTAATTDGAIIDADFTKMVSVETVALTLGGNVTLADKAMLAGITTVDLSNSAGNTTVDASGFAKTLNVTLGANTDTITTHQTAVMNDFISTTSANLDGTDVINLGAGNSDTILITDGANLTSTNLSASLTNIEVLKLGNVGNHSVDFTSSASSISMIDGSLMTSSQTSTINITGKTETIEVKMGAGNDTIKMSLADLTKYSTADTTDNSIHDAGTAPAQKYINGGAGLDTIIITNAGAVITDNLFDAPDLALLGTEKLIGIEAIGLAAGGTITLGKHASVEGITTINVSDSTGNSTISTTAVTKDITVNLGANDDSVTTGGRADTVNIASTNLTAADTISLGAGVDTLNITTAINYANATNFGGIENVEVLKLSSDAAGQTVVLTGTTFTSLDARSMRAGDVTVDMSGLIGGVGTAKVTDRIAVSLGEGSDTVKMDFANFSTVSQNINGGGGNDTIEITDNVTLTDGDFTNRKMSSFETIKLKGSLTVGANFNSIGISNVVASDALTFNSSALTKAFTFTSSTGNDVITLSDGNDIIKGIGGNDNINTGKGDDKFYLEGNELDASDTVTAGLGNDTIIFTSTIGTLADAAFTNVTGIETIQFGDFNGQTFTYGNFAQHSGVQTVGLITTNIDASALTAANGFTLDSGSLTGDAIFNFIGGKGNDLIKTKSDYFLSTDRIDGKEGTDTIEITNAATITDLSFSNVRNIEKIKLGDFANSLTLGGRFQDSGILNIELAAASTAANSIDMSSVGSQKAYNIQGTAGIETITMQNDVLRNGNVTIDGKGGVDVLVISNGSSLTDTAFTNITNVETVKLSNFNNTLELGNKASTAGIKTVDGSTITTGNIILDMTNMTANIDTVLKGGGSIDTFKIKVDHLTAGDTINGGNGIDVLTLSTTGAAITDADFTNVTFIETLTLVKDADYNITLNSASTTFAQTAGIVEVKAETLLSDDMLILDATNYTVGLKVTSGAGNDTITSGTGNDSIVTGSGNDTISSGTGNDILDGGAGDDKFIFTTTSLTNGDKVNGNTGNDTLNITDAVALDGLSSAFQYVSGIERLELDGGGSVVMNTAMINSGIREIDGSGSTAALTINGSAGTTGTRLVLTGGSGNDKIFAGHGTDTLEGGAGDDTFVFSSVARDNGANVIKDFGTGTDKIALSFAIGSKDYEDTARVDAGTLSTSDFGNYVEDVSYDKYDTDNNGTLDGDYALVTLTGGDTISLLGVSSGIDNADFFYQLV